ncbi:MAG: hypothetical protein ABI301_02700, partial [Jatrophihabitantaceae bacterium]
MSSSAGSSARPSRRRPAVPTDSGGLFGRLDALAGGWTDDALAHAVASGRTVRIKRGVFALATECGDRGPDALRQANLRLARATARLCTRAVLSHASSAIAYDLPTVCALDRPCLTVPAGTALRRLSQVHLHRATLAAQDVTSVGGLPATGPARTVLALAREHGVDAGVAAADAALHLGRTSLTALEHALGQCAGWPGRAAAGKTVRLCDGRAESALESLSRLRLARFAVPPPEPQVELGDEWGRFVGRA